MEFLQTLLTPLVLVILGIPAAYLLKERLDRLEARIDAQPTRAEWDARWTAADARFDRIESELASLRSDITHIALAVGARTRPETG